MIILYPNTVQINIQVGSFHYSFLKRFVYPKVWVTQRKGERNLLSLGSVSRWMQWLGVMSDQKQEPETSSGSVMVGSKGPSACAIFCWFPRHMNRELHWKRNRQDLNWHSNMQYKHYRLLDVINCLFQLCSSECLYCDSNYPSSFS